MLQLLVDGEMFCQLDNLC